MVLFINIPSVLIGGRATPCNGENRFFTGDIGILNVKAQRTIVKARETDVQFRRGDVFRHLYHAPYAVNEGEVVVSGQEVADLGRISRRYAIARPQVGKRRMVSRNLSVN